MANVYYVTGSKGGVGKSTVAKGLIDLLESKGRQHVIVDSDVENQDLIKALGTKSDAGRALNLNTRQGWIRLVNEAVKTPDVNFVLVGGAQQMQAAKEAARLVDRALVKSGTHRFVTLWVIGGTRDSVELLHRYLELMKNVAMSIYVIKNEGVVDADAGEWDFFDGSTAKSLMEKRGGKVLEFPRVERGTLKFLDRDRKTIQKALEGADLEIGERIDLEIWQEEIHEALGPVVA